MNTLERRKTFLPVAGLMVVGLVGTSYALCYGKTTYTCARVAEYVGDVSLPCGVRQAYAQSAWYYTNHATQLPYNTPGFSHAQVNWVTPCTGPAYYVDCNANVQTISNYTNSHLTYDPINTTSLGCSS